MSFIQEMTSAYNDMLDIKASLGFSRHNYKFHISPFIDFCADRYPDANGITKDMIDQWLVSKTFRTDNTPYCHYQYPTLHPIFERYWETRVCTILRI